MATNGGAVDALQRELIKAGRKSKRSVVAKSEPTKREISKLTKALKG